jgi:8-oxo-dGTP pyrophosphatase MutT (NUDIX family)
MLLTSRQTCSLGYSEGMAHGWAEAPAQVAARETYEEAGSIGAVSGRSRVGHYRYRKRLSKGKFVTCDVVVFLLRVRRDPPSGRKATSACEHDSRWRLSRKERDFAMLIVGAVSDKLM